ncbi:unnamed protein product [Bathycoccus prasinos]
METDGQERSSSNLEKFFTQTHTSHVPHIYLFKRTYS